MVRSQKVFEHMDTELKRLHPPRPPERCRARCAQAVSIFPTKREARIRFVRSMQEKTPSAMSEKNKNSEVNMQAGAATQAERVVTRSRRRCLARYTWSLARVARAGNGAIVKRSRAPYGQSAGRCQFARDICRAVPLPLDTNIRKMQPRVVGNSMIASMRVERCFDDKLLNAARKRGHHAIAAPHPKFEA